MDEHEQQPVPLTRPASPPPVAEVDMRASDAERDRVADILREALAEGRLTAEEHSERIDRVYTAKTVGELEPLVRDLPAPREAGGKEAAPDRPAAPHSRVPVAAANLVAVFGGAVRRGRWRVGRRTTAFACFGGVEIDLTEAVFEQQEVVVHATAIFGGVDIRVPENVSLRGAGTGVFGGFDVKTHEAPDPEAPVVVVSGFALFGGVDAKPKRGKRVRNLLDRSHRHFGH